MSLTCLLGQPLNYRLVTCSPSVWTDTNQTPHMSPWLVAILTAWCREPPLYVIFAGSQEPAFVMFPVHCLFCCCSSPRLPLGDTCRQRRWRPRTLDTHTRPRQDILFVSGVIWITRKNIKRIAKKNILIVGCKYSVLIIW